MVPFLSQAFTPIISAIFNALAASSSSVNDEEARLERQSLQRAYFSFIAAIIGSNLVEVLASQDSATLQQVLLSLVQGAVDYPDPVVSPHWFLLWFIAPSFLIQFVRLGPKELLFHPATPGGNLGREGRAGGICRVRLQASRSRLLPRTSP